MGKVEKHRNPQFFGQDLGQTLLTGAESKLLKYQFLFKFPKRTGSE
jgi:hypothetical protein